MTAPVGVETDEEWREHFEKLVDRLGRLDHIRTRDSELMIQEGGDHTQRPRWRLILRHPGSGESHIGPGHATHEQFEAFLRGLEMSPRVHEKSKWGN